MLFFFNILTGHLNFKIAEVTDGPDKVINMPFFFPVVRGVLMRRSYGRTCQISARKGESREPGRKLKKADMTILSEENKLSQLHIRKKRHVKRIKDCFKGAI